MSRGTRSGYDVMGNMPEEEPADQLPEEITFPDSFNPGTGRILGLNNHLRLVYEDLAATQNKIDRACDSKQKTTPLHGPHYFLLLSIFQGQIDDYGDVIPTLAARAKSLIAEVQAVGGEPFVAGFARQFFNKAPEAVTLANGSLSYLCNTPHYFPDEISVPQGLPAVEVYKGTNPQNVGECNRFLQIRYSALARNVNRIRYFRDHRLRLGVDAQATVVGNLLTSKIQDCHKILAKLVEVINRRRPSYGDQIFLMPAAVRDKILEDHSIINHSQLPDISCLYPEGIPQSNPIHRGTAIFLLFESAVGYSLFWAYNYNTISPDALLSFENLGSVVKLMVYYPFASQAIAIQEFREIRNDTCSVMLKLFLEMHLPEPAAWSWNIYRLGVRNKKFGQSVENTTGIPCRKRKHSVKELRAGIANYLHLFLEMEQTQLTEAQQALENGLDDDNAQE